MFDEEAVANRWILRSVKLAVATGAVLLAGWWAMQLRGSRGPKKKSPAQQIAVVRNHSEKPLARRIAAEALEEADASIANPLAKELSSGDAVGRQLAAFALGRLDGEGPGAVDGFDRGPGRPRAGSTTAGGDRARPPRRLGRRKSPRSWCKACTTPIRRLRGAMFKALHGSGEKGLGRSWVCWRTPTPTFAARQSSSWAAPEAARANSSTRFAAACATPTLAFAPRRTRPCGSVRRRSWTNQLPPCTTPTRSCNRPPARCWAAWGAKPSRRLANSESWWP